MGLLTTVILLVIFFVAGARTHQPIFLVGFLFLMLWVVLVCFARFVRWLAGLTISPGKEQNKKTASRSRSCPDPRCGRVNVWEARFCGQCGRRLA